MKRMDLRSNRSRVLQEITDDRIIESRRSSVGSNEQFPDSLLTPSPDEQIIKSRGRKTGGISEDCDASGNLLSYLHGPAILKTPTKAVSKITYSLPVRSSPRKRLQLEEPNSPSPHKIKVQSQLVKRQRNQHSTSTVSDPEIAIRGLSHNQLVEMLIHIMAEHPHLKQEIKSVMPLPDLTSLEDRLSQLSRSILKSSPTTRLGSVGDALHFNRVKGHLTEFKKTCIEQSKALLSSHQWASVIDYALLTWTYVHKLPDWDSPAHNKVKEQCFSSLASHCMTALKHGVFDVAHYNDVKDRLEEAKLNCRDIETCIKFIENILKKSS